MGSIPAVRSNKHTMETTSKDHGQAVNRKFLTDTVAKIKYLDFEFALDSISTPSDEQVARISSENPYKLRTVISHMAADTDDGASDEKRRITFFGYADINKWSEVAVARAVFVTLMQKLRHEASETFKLGNDKPFHEHRTTENIEIPK